MPRRPAHVQGWQSARLDGRRLRLATGTWLDLGATAKGLGADRAAREAAVAVPAGGVLISLGGDIAVAGEAPVGGWPVLVADEPEPGRQPASGGGPAQFPPRSPGQVVRLAAGALATSSIMCRQWRRGGRTLHHIVDPRTGLPAAGPWRTVSVAAANCAEANAASTAAIIAGSKAPAWLAAQGLPARLVARDGSVRLAGGWPAIDDGLLEPPGTGRMPAGTGPVPGSAALAGAALVGPPPPGPGRRSAGRTPPGPRRSPGARRWR
jgi:thiamine biosynthesis lipoprotein